MSNDIDLVIWQTSNNMFNDIHRVYINVVVINILSNYIVFRIAHVIKKLPWIKSPNRTQFKKCINRCEKKVPYYTLNRSRNTDTYLRNRKIVLR